MDNLFYENIYELIKTICICFGLGIWTFISIWLGYIAGHTKGYDKGKKEGSIESLENIKDEINIKRDNLLNSEDLNLLKKCNIQGYSDSMGILNKYISGLKEIKNEPK